MALARKFFFDAEPFTAYKRLLILEKSGFIGSYPVKGRFNEAWILRDKGFKYIQPHLGDLRSEGYKSANYPHDFLSSAFHLGEWLVNQPENSQTYSEQQLRCYSEDLWPAWVPRSTMHRPDGYSVLQSKEKRLVVAFETELNLKTKHRYEKVATFYDSQTCIDLVLWLIDSRGTMNSIKKNFEKFLMRDLSKHQFILLSDFIKIGWMANIVEGSFRGKSPMDLLMHKTHTIPTQKSLACVTLSLLDTRRRPSIPNI